MGDKSRLCVQCGRFIIGSVVQAAEGPVHDCGGLLAGVERLRAELDFEKKNNAKLGDRLDVAEAEVERLRARVQDLEAVLNSLQRAPCPDKYDARWFEAERALKEGGK
jgi:predicted nuclease with TOPRIM domain